MVSETSPIFFPINLSCHDESLDAEPVLLMPGITRGMSTCSLYFLSYSVLFLA